MRRQLGTLLRRTQLHLTLLLVLRCRLRCCRGRRLRRGLFRHLLVDQFGWWHWLHRSTAGCKKEQKKWELRKHCTAASTS